MKIGKNWLFKNNKILWTNGCCIFLTLLKQFIVNKKTVIHYYSIHTVVVYTCLNSQQNFTTRNKYNATWQSSGLIQQAVQNNGAIVYNHGFKVLFIKSSVNANFVSVIMSVGCWNNFVICSETWKSLLEHVLLSYVDNSRHTILCL